MKCLLKATRAVAKLGREAKAVGRLSPPGHSGSHRVASLFCTRDQGLRAMIGFSSHTLSRKFQLLEPGGSLDATPQGMGLWLGGVSRGSAGGGGLAGALSSTVS